MAKVEIRVFHQTATICVYIVHAFLLLQHDSFLVIVVFLFTLRCQQHY
ncbi:hypothetical protein AAFF_G00355400 [Aldrovandia affinis]|uniref:Uncharacterized protein n=1 Tax=Aldrovandia affinis TaxID=143900 RepID=A0AAD7SJ97_9TELE|nr:hypothetical protein AAFF_G00355400 [Aldrovandia affinis]